MRPIVAGFALVLSTYANAQFVYPKPEYNIAEPGLYKEDPFIVKYRREFFSVFKGDFPRFNQAFEEIKKMVEANPKDARARVWLGNGLTIKAGLAMGAGKSKESIPLVESSRKELDAAVALSPKDPNIYMMRAATLYIQGQYWPAALIPKSNWEKLRDDCEKFIVYIGNERMKKVSIHLRGEAYGELGIAYARLGKIDKASEAFKKVIELNPNTDYEVKARKEIEKLKTLNK